MPYKVDIYIGSDNGTKRISEDYLKKVRDWADDALRDGYMLVRGNGRYNGISEESILINAVSDGDVDLRGPLRNLKRELNQEAILLVKSSVDSEML